MAPSGTLRLDQLFHALADTTRRDILLALERSPGATTSALLSLAPHLSRWAVMKHVAVLREAGLVQTLPDGRRRRHYRDERALEPARRWLEALGTG
jgi:predicted transcriptional regulator